MNNTYLIGMMGSGKSQTGKALAELLGCEFCDTDELIEKKHSLSVSEIFASKGETWFREAENEVLLELSQKMNQVVATGGGIILRSQNVEAMRDTGNVIYLEAAVDVLWEYVRGSTNRPLLGGENPEEQFRNIYESRRPLYEKSCKMKVVFNKENPSEVAKRISEILEK